MLDARLDAEESARKAADGEEREAMKAAVGEEREARMAEHAISCSFFASMDKSLLEINEKLTPSASAQRMNDID